MLARMRKALEARKARWEALCRRCGLCCYEKDIRGLQVVTNFRRPCRYLDISSRECTIYERRFQLCPECRPMTLRHAMFVRWLPDSCGYVQRFRPRLRAGVLPAGRPPRRA